MISEQEYFKFSKKLNKILKKCFIGTIYPENNNFEESNNYTQQGFIPHYGSSSLTQQNRYFFNKPVVIENRDAILEICAFLPKLKTIKEGTAGTIAYIDLLSEGKNTLESLTEECEQADKFVSLLVLAGIGLPSETFIGNENFSATTIDLHPRYKSIVNPNKSGQEPADD